MSEDLTGKRLGHYRIDGILGRGGMSVMYRATDVRLGRKVALKVIAAHLGGDAEFRERFVDEARNTSAIDHSHVVPLYDFGDTDGLLYIAMRFVDGSDLASHISDGPISPARAIVLLGQVAEALDMVHDQGLVHLDIKPANMLVTTKETTGEHVYLADFGLTRRGATGHRTKSGDFLGSPTYAAPEHLRGEPVDRRTDMYSLTCVLYACLTGRPPYKGKVPEVIQGHLAGEVPLVNDIVELPGAIEAVIKRGMAKNPADRYEDCRALLTAARKALVTTPNPTRPPVLRSDKPVPPVPKPTPSGPHPSVSGPHPTVSGPYPVPGHTTGQHPVNPQVTGGHSIPSGPYPVPQQPPIPGLPAEPVRLRAPMPAQANVFTKTSNKPDWFYPAIVGGVLILIILIIVLAI
ncbi:serine/threonine protein kinase [Pseudonocardiaceae bacterium YIM PH 21723]|nr:serine/threonine protein kinase [Pseudonocardiaceae bacterium YIM PH 21723]